MSGALALGAGTAHATDSAYAMCYFTESTILGTTGETPRAGVRKDVAGRRLNGVDPTAARVRSRS
ncbi:hypothetical protein AB0M05_27255 [Streptomyces violaceusniger]|uniref:hypothetical protein n=1 Tax=Streptomyces violaceusniger TaxID=68280 RepID=UPI003433CA3C